MIYKVLTNTHTGVACGVMFIVVKKMDTKTKVQILDEIARTLHSINIFVKGMKKIIFHTAIGKQLGR